MATDNVDFIFIFALPVENMIDRFPGQFECHFLDNRWYGPEKWAAAVPAHFRHITRPAQKHRLNFF
jgi:hypothetical protein